MEMKERGIIWKTPFEEKLCGSLRRETPTDSVLGFYRLGVARRPDHNSTRGITCYPKNQDIWVQLYPICNQKTDWMTEKLRRNWVSCKPCCRRPGTLKIVKQAFLERGRKFFLWDKTSGRPKIVAGPGNTKGSCRMNSAHRMTMSPISIRTDSRFLPFKWAQALIEEGVSAMKLLVIERSR